MKTEAMTTTERNEHLGERLEDKPFEINDAGTANWYLKTLRNLESEKATIQAQTAAMLRSLDAEINRFRFRFEPQFQGWVEQELARRGSRSKTLPLHQGTAAFRTVPASLRVMSSRDALDYARSQGWPVIRSVETLDAEGYKSQAAAVQAETGEVLPGIEVIPERESFSVRFGTAKDADPEVDENRDLK